MSNETIKTYTEITVEEAGEMLRDNGWKPVEGLVFTDNSKRDGGQWFSDKLIGISVLSESKFESNRCCQWNHCAKVTEIDPCKAPEGCPELEPWMAYVGDQWEDKGKGIGRNEPSIRWIWGDVWVGCERHCGLGINRPYAIDVRTKWSQEHFPEHCRIRNYQEPDAFEGFVAREALVWLGAREYSLAKRAYELGQQNPTK